MSIQSEIRLRLLLRSCLLLVLIGCFEYCHAQPALLDTRISIHCLDKPLFELLDEIERSYRIPFSYFKNQLPLQKKITITLHNETLQTVLTSIQLQTGIQYQAIGGQVVLKEGKQNQFITKSTPPKKPEQGFLKSSAFEENTEEKKTNMVLTKVKSNYFFADRLGVLADQNKEKASKNSLVKKTGKSPRCSSLFITGEKQNTKLETKGLPTSLNYLTNPYQPGNFYESSPYRLNPAKHLVPPSPGKPLSTNTTFQLSLVPGVGTHGIHPGEYTNAVSVNLLAGYSAGNEWIEIAGLSNFNQNQVFGLQIGGLANVIGGNKFIGLSSQEKQKLKKENTESNLQGIQMSGLTNIIAGNVFGWQTTGGINIVQKSLQGVQVAGVSNLVQTYTFGIQLAGISNAAMESVDGVQVASLYNYTKGELHGIQLSAFNQAGHIEGKRSLVSVNHTGLQIGLLNTARRMNGFQVGLINLGGNMAGTQIGLINLNSGKEGNGVPVGLLNLNTKNHFIRLYSSELFASNLEISTGSLRIQNIVSFAYNPFTASDFYQYKWSTGYSIGQIKRPSRDFFYSYDAGLAYVHPGGKLTRQLSMLTKARITAGYRIRLRKLVFHLFGGITFNTFFAEGDRSPLSPDVLRIYHKNTGSSHIEVWPGLQAGFHLH